MAGVSLAIKYTSHPPLNFFIHKIFHVKGKRKENGRRQNCVYDACRHVHLFHRFVYMHISISGFFFFYSISYHILHLNFDKLIIYICLFIHIFLGCQEANGQDWKRHCCTENPMRHCTQKKCDNFCNRTCGNHKKQNKCRKGTNICHCSC